MKNKAIFKQISSAAVTAALIAGSIVPAMAAEVSTPNTSIDGVNAGTQAATDANTTSEKNDLKNFDIIDNEAKGSLTIYKYDFTSAQNDNIDFKYNLEGDNTSTNTSGHSTMVKDGQTIDIESTGHKNASAEEALKNYAIQGVEFTYLKVSDIMTLNNSDNNIDYTPVSVGSIDPAAENYFIKAGDNYTAVAKDDIKSDGSVQYYTRSQINGDIETVYAIDPTLMSILNLTSYDSMKDGTPVSGGQRKDSTGVGDLLDYTKTNGIGDEQTYWAAVTQDNDGKQYFTSQQINNALAQALDYGYCYNAQGYTEYATADGENTKPSHDPDSLRQDGAKGISVKDALEKYIVEKGGTEMADTDATGMTTKDNMDLGLYLIVETKVPENVTCTVNPWFVTIPMTNNEANDNDAIDDKEGNQWVYDIFCYPKNQTGHPTLEKKVRNAYGSQGLNYDSSHTANTGNVVTKGDVYSDSSLIVTNDDTKTGVHSATVGDADVAKNAAFLSGIDEIKADTEYSSTTTASEGDYLDMILISKLPQVTSTATYLKTYEFIDTMEDGLKFCQDMGMKIAVYTDAEAAAVNDTTKAIEIWSDGNEFNTTYSAGSAANTADPNYPLTDTGLARTDGSTYANIALTAEGLKKVNEQYYDGNHYIVAYYTAQMESDETTVLGDEGNDNDVNLVWQRTNDLYYNTIEDRAIVYSYGIDLTKTFSDKAGDPTKVDFVLYNETEDYYVIAKPDATIPGLYYVTGKTVSKYNDTSVEGNSDAATATVFTPDANGKLIINGIEADEYKLVEVATDEGYSLLANQIDVVITPSSRDITASSVRHMTEADDVKRVGTENGGTQGVDTEYNDDMKDDADDSKGTTSTATIDGDTIGTDIGTGSSLENSYDDMNLVLSNGKLLKTKDEGTTDKDGLVIGALVSATCTVNGETATFENYKTATRLDAADIANTKDAADTDSANAAVVLSVLNSKNFLLPKTGGAGLYLITILGVVAVVGGAYSYKRKKDCVNQ